MSNCTGQYLDTERRAELWIERSVVCARVRRRSDNALARNLLTGSFERLREPADGSVPDRHQSSTQIGFMTTPLVSRSLLFGLGGTLIVVPLVACDAANSARLVSDAGPRGGESDTGGSQSTTEVGGSAAGGEVAGGTTSQNAGGDANTSGGMTTEQTFTAGATSTFLATGGGTEAPPNSGGATSVQSNGGTTAALPTGGTTALQPTGGTLSAQPTGGTTALQPTGGTLSVQPTGGALATGGRVSTGGLPATAGATSTSACSSLTMPTASGRMTVAANGYTTNYSGAAKGFATTWVGAKSIVPATCIKPSCTTNSCTPQFGTSAICATGMIAADTTYLSVAGISFNLNQVNVTGAVANTIPAPHSFSVSFTKSGTAQMRIQITDGTTYWCYDASASSYTSGGTLYPSDFNTKCWDLTGTNLTAGTPISSIELIFPAYTTSLSFSACMTDFTIISS